MNNARVSGIINLITRSEYPSFTYPAGLCYLLGTAPKMGWVITRNFSITRACPKAAAGQEQEQKAHDHTRVAVQESLALSSAGETLNPISARPLPALGNLFFLFHS